MSQDCTLLIGGADGIRTHDLLDAIEARSQLRHGPTDQSYRKVYHIYRNCNPVAPSACTRLVTVSGV
jgi:hypothetical protein